MHRADMRLARREIPSRPKRPRASLRHPLLRTVETTQTDFERALPVQKHIWFLRGYLIHTQKIMIVSPRLMTIGLIHICISMNG